MKNKIEKFLLATLITFAYLLPIFAVADGGLVPPLDRYIYETDQKAVIFYDQGVENLILQITFEGDAKDFAWIIPTPKQPQVEKSTDTLFARLDELTRPEEEGAPMSAGFGLMNTSVDDVGRSVRVVETKKIEYYDINVLEASDKNALYNWLNDNGYAFPQQGKYIIDDYIQKGWYFTAVKIDNESVSDLVEGQLQNGHAIPLKLSFETEEIIYPLKISSLNGLKDKAPEGKISYVDGVANKAALINSDRMIVSDRVIPDFNISSGKIKFHLKKRNSDPLNNIIKIEKVSSLNSVTKIGLKISNQRENVFNFELYLDSFREDFLVNLADDFKENQWQSYEFDWNLDPASNSFITKFYIDGIERTLSRTSPGNNRMAVINDGIPSEKAVMTIGGEFYANGPMTTIEKFETPRDEDYFVDHNGDILIDELMVESQGQPVLNANFEDNLDFFLRNGSGGTFRVYSSPKNVSNYSHSNSTGILLYVFADKKQEATGFNVQYAGPIKKDEIKELAIIEGKPWIDPSENKYFLTRLYDSMNTSEMTEDVYFRKSENQGTVNYNGIRPSVAWIAYGAVSICLISIVMFVLVVSKKSETVGAEKKNVGAIKDSNN